MKLVFEVWKRVGATAARELDLRRIQKMWDKLLEAHGHRLLHESEDIRYWAAEKAYYEGVKAAVAALRLGLQEEEKVEGLEAWLMELLPKSERI